MVRGLSWEEVTVPFPRVERCDEVHLAAEMDGIGLRWQGGNVCRRGCAVRSCIRPVRLALYI